MSRYTEAYSRFLKRLSEVETLLRLARDTSRTLPVLAALPVTGPLCRSGVVLLCSHVEGFVEDIGKKAIEEISARSLPKARLGPRFRYHLSRDIIRKIKDSTDPADVASGIEQLLARDGHIWDTSINFRSPLLDEIFIGDFVNPTHKRIRKFFDRFGYSRYENDLAAQLAANFMACTNMVDQVVHQRNQIAHGDTTTIGTPNDLAQMIDLVKMYGRAMDFVVAGWFRAQGCPIRHRVALP